MARRKRRHTLARIFNPLNGKIHRTREKKGNEIRSLVSLKQHKTEMADRISASVVYIAFAARAQ